MRRPARRDEAGIEGVLCGSETIDPGAADQQTAARRARMIGVSVPNSKAYARGFVDPLYGAVPLP